MANLVQSSSGIFSIRFRLGNQRLHRSLETTSEKEAKEGKVKIEKTIRLVHEGEKELSGKVRCLHWGSSQRDHPLRGG